MSSAFWLGWRAMLGLIGRSKTTQNMLRTRECVLNLPSDSLAPAVDRLALTTGQDPVPQRKLDRGYRFEPDKFGVSGLTPVAAETVLPPRVTECPVNMEAIVEGVHPVAGDDEAQRGNIVAIEVRIQAPPPAEGGDYDAGVRGRHRRCRPAGYSGCRGDIQAARAGIAEPACCREPP
jgi:flavin reductase (DIM6/NTAB) family NADH-FMN oxidoreductase RutF